MSREELNRLEISDRVLERRLTQAQAAEQLGLSVRQVERLCHKLRVEGAPGLVVRRQMFSDFRTAFSAESFFAMDSFLLSEPGTLSWIRDRKCPNSADGLQS